MSLCLLSLKGDGEVKKEEIRKTVRELKRNIKKIQEEKEEVIQTAKEFEKTVQKLVLRRKTTTNRTLQSTGNGIQRTINSTARTNRCKSE